MGLFKFFKKEKEIVIPQPDEGKVKWFFSEEAEATFKRTLHSKDEMLSIWFAEGGKTELIAYTSGESVFRRGDFPCTFFADYLRALKTIDVPRLAMNAVHLAMDGDWGTAIPYPDCLKAEYNPLINFALKIKPIYYSKNGTGIEYNAGMNMLIAYLHDVYTDYSEDESNESWIYEKSLWFNEKGKVREWQEITARIRENVKRKDCLLSIDKL